LYGHANLDDTVTRLTAYRDAGADVLYAPGLSDADAISTVVAIGLPVNVLALAHGPSVADLEAIGVRRVSTGSALFNAARKTLRKAATELRDLGTSTYAM
jgi:2-methylisocitrate lyase-like PEP mutase family enzyme